MVAYPADEPLLTIERSRSDEGEERLRHRPRPRRRVSRCCTGRSARTARCRGLLELANLPYVGAGVLASAVGMDKAVMKVVFAGRGAAGQPGTRGAAPRMGRDARRHRRVRAPRASAIRSSSSRPTSDRASASRRPRISHGARPRHRPRLRVRSQGRSSSRRCRRPARSRCAVLGNDDPEASVAGEIVPQARVLRLRGEVPRRPVGASSSRRRSRRSSRTTIRRMAIEAFRAIDARGHGARGLPAGAADRPAVRQRGEHDPRLHHDQHVREAVGRQRPRLSRRCSIASSGWRSRATPTSSG